MKIGAILFTLLAASCAFGQQEAKSPTPLLTVNVIDGKVHSTNYARDASSVVWTPKVRLPFPETMGACLANAETRFKLGITAEQTAKLNGHHRRIGQLSRSFYAEYKAAERAGFASEKEREEFVRRKAVERDAFALAGYSTILLPSQAEQLAATIRINRIVNHGVQAFAEGEVAKHLELDAAEQKQLKSQVDDRTRLLEKKIDEILHSHYVETLNEVVTAAQLQKIEGALPGGKK